MMASRALQHRIKSAHLCWSTGLTTHAMQIVDISIGKPPQYLQWVPPEAYPEPAITPIDADSASRGACHLYQADWKLAKASQDVDLMWQVISRAAHHLHMELAGVRYPYGQQRQRAKLKHRDEYGPGKHKEGLPESL